MLSKNTLTVFSVALGLSACVAVGGNLKPQYTLADGTKTEILNPGQAYEERVNGNWWYKMPLMFFASGGSIAGLMLFPSMQRRYTATMREAEIQANARDRALAEVFEEEARAIAIDEAEKRAVAAAPATVEYALPPATVEQDESVGNGGPVNQTATVQGVASPEQVIPSGDGSKEAPRNDWEPLFKELFSAKNSDQTFLYPCIFVTGRQGTGKTTFLKYIQQFLDGDVTVIDTHYKKGNWQGCKIIGKGKNYYQVEQFLDKTLSETERLYSRYANMDNPGFKPVTIIAEEMTNWDGEMEDEEIAGKFMKTSLSDFRKIMYRLISVAHADTNTARGGAKGTRRMREQGEVRIELLEKGLAFISMPGHDPFYLRFPNLEDHTPAPKVESQQPTAKAKEALGKPAQVLQLRLEGTDFKKAICQVYGCEPDTGDFNKARLEVLHNAF